MKLKPIPQSRIDTLEQLTREAAHLLAGVQALPKGTMSIEQRAVLVDGVERVVDTLHNLTIAVSYERQRRLGVSR